MNRQTPLTTLTAAFFLTFAVGLARAAEPSNDDVLANTFSIVAADPETSELGVAVATRLPAVGMYVPVAEPGVAAVASQAIVNPEYGPAMLRLLREGVSPEDAISSVTAADPRRADRQLTVIDLTGRGAGFTGTANSQVCAHLVGKNCVAAGNLLATTDTVPAIVSAFEKSEGRLSDRLLEALAAGERAGGDKRGKQSAALLVVKRGAYFNGKVLELRVDDSPHPIAELKRVHAATMTGLSATPGYQPISLGSTGPEIRKLNTWLRNAGHGDAAALTASADRATTATSTALHSFLQKPEDPSTTTLLLTPAESHRLQRAATQKGL